MPDTPRVFISHSSKDNVRFVLDFARRLRAKGVDAWLDYWELLPGDSLVDKIWNKGLKDCQAFIVVLSEHSLTSRWVREELNTAIVKRIEDNTRLIVLKLDDCQIPEPLRDTVWVEIRDTVDYEQDFDRIVNAIFGQYARPPLGEVPPYIRSQHLHIGDLARIDSIIFEAACRAIVDAGPGSYIHGEELAKSLAEQGISREAVMETQEILERRGFIKLHRVLGPAHRYKFHVTELGFDRFVRAAYPEYPKLCQDVIRCVVRDSLTTNFAISERLECPLQIVSHILKSLHNHGLLKCAESFGTGSGLQVDVFWFSPELRRELEEK